MLHLCDCRISLSTEPTVGLFSPTALARLLKMREECVKQVRNPVKWRRHWRDLGCHHQSGRSLWADEDVKEAIH